jgi:CubicO group peptidase (beta-lactamase class C family)
MRNILLIILAALFSSSAISFPASSQTVADKLETYCDTQHSPDLAGGFEVSAIKDGEVIFKKAYGTGNAEYGIPLSTTSVFDFASVAKQFTGWAVAKLITEGRMSPDDDIHEYVPDLPDFGHRITISHLLHHTSGLRDWVCLMKLAGKENTDVHSREILRKVICNQRELNFVPGEEFSYSNTGYFLLAEAVEKTTGRDFGDWCRENIFEPLGMGDTRFLKSHTEITKNRAMAYRQYGEDGYANCFAQLDSPGSSSLYSTLDDMTKWLLTVDERKFGGSEVWDIMLAKGTLDNGDSVEYGYGLTLGTYESHTVIRHGGHWLGYLSDLVYFPDERVGYVLMITRTPPAVSISGKVDDILLGIADPGIAKDNENEQQPGKEESDAPTGEAVSESFLKKCTGAYYSKERALRIEVRDEKGAMKIDFPWQSGLDVIARPDRRFYIEEYKYTFTFVTGDDGRVTGLEFIRKDRISRYNRLQLDASGWADIEVLLGEYYCDELQATYSFTLKQDSLVVRSLLNPDVALVRYDGNYFLGDSWWFSNVNLTRDENGEITGFLLGADQGRIRNLEFKKKH